jgi:hypothetical protein
MFSDAVSARTSLEKIDGISTNFCLHFGEKNFKEAEPHKMFAIASISVVLRPFVRVNSTGTVCITQH